MAMAITVMQMRLLIAAPTTYMSTSERKKPRMVSTPTPRMSPMMRLAARAAVSRTRSTSLEHTVTTCAVYGMKKHVRANVTRQNIMR